MKKITLIAFISAIMYSALFAQEIPEEQKKYINEYLKSQGMPELGSGFSIDDRKPNKSRIPFQRPDRIERYDDNVKKFLEFEITAQHQYKLFGNRSSHPYDSHLRHTLQEFNLIMAYTFIGAPEHIVTKHIGYAPYVTYIEHEGWAGGIHFFKHHDLICRFSENNIKLSHAIYRETANKVGTEVNGKYTMLAIIGNQDSGYMYTVNWYDPHFFRSLECASHQDFSDMMPRVINMAIQIDAHQ